MRLQLHGDEDAAAASGTWTGRVDRVSALPLGPTCGWGYASVRWLKASCARSLATSSGKLLGAHTWLPSVWISLVLHVSIYANPDKPDKYVRTLTPMNARTSYTYEHL
jgi:hypothetical protein